MTVQSRILEDFIKGDDAKKIATIQVTDPLDLGVESDIYKNLGVSRQVWLAYLHQVGLNGFLALPQEVQEQQILPLLVIDQSEKTIVILLEANAHVTIALGVLSVWYKKPTCILAHCVDAVKALKERGLPLISTLLKDPDYTQVAFSFFNPKQWTDQAALQDLTFQVNALLLRTTSEQDVVQCARVLAMIDPVQLIRFATDVLTELDRELVRKIEGYLTAAYYKLEDQELKKEFALKMIQANLPLVNFPIWDIVCLLVSSDEAALYQVISTTSNYVRAKLAAELAAAKHSASAQAFQRALEPITKVIYRMFDEGQPIHNFLPFLVEARMAFESADLVEFMIRTQHLGESADELSYDALYNEASPELLMEYLGVLNGRPESDVALAILKKLNGEPEKLEAHREAFVKAMDAVVYQYTSSDPQVRDNSVQIVQMMPVEYWPIHLKIILDRAQPVFAIQFAIFILQKEEENEQASKTFLRLFNSGDPKVQSYVKGYLKPKKKVEEKAAE